MSEIWAGLQAVLGVLGAVIAAIFFMLGGRSIEELKKWKLNLFGDKSNRIWGRVVAPIFFATWVVLLSLTSHWSWYHLLGYASYFAVSRLGYGGNTLWTKILRRTLWSVLFTAASLVYALGGVTPNFWLIYLSQVLVGLFITVLWGVTNPMLAPREEYIIKLSNLLFVPLLVL